jgi:hypothetical protein
MRIGAQAVGQHPHPATAPDRRPATPLTRREQEDLLHVIERAVRDWPDLDHVAKLASRNRGGRAGYLILHSAARDLLAVRDKLRARLDEELRPRGG